MLTLRLDERFAACVEEELGSMPTHAVIGLLDGHDYYYFRTRSVVNKVHPFNALSFSTRAAKITKTTVSTALCSSVVTVSFQPGPLTNLRMVRLGSMSKVKPSCARSALQNFGPS